MAAVTCERCGLSGLHVKAPAVPSHSGGADSRCWGRMERRFLT